MIRQVKFGVVTAVLLALLGLPLGWLWRSISPHVRYGLVDHVAYLVNPEDTGLIGTDGRFAMIALVAGTVSGLVAYLLAGRDNELGMLAGICLGGAAGSLDGWAVGTLPGRAHFYHLVHTLPDGKILAKPPELTAYGVLVIWPLLAVVVFAFLEATDIARRHTFRLPERPLAAGDLGRDRAGQPDQVGGGEFDLQSAPPGRDVEGRQP